MKLTGPLIRGRKLIGITPLIDVVFILLFFFMLTASFERWQATDLSLTSHRVPMRAQAVSRVMWVRSGAEVRWQGRWHDVETLATRLSDTAPELMLILRPTPDASIQDLVRVMEVLRREGRNQVSLSVAK